MAIKFSRRQLIQLGLAGSALSLLPTSVRARANTALLSAASNPAGNHFIRGLSAAGHTTFSVPVQYRCHDSSVNPDLQQAIFFARRPGQCFYVIDITSGEMIHTITPKNGYHFYGHGVFSDDHRWLYTTENDFVHQRGIIGVYDAADNYRRVDEFSSGGIGPHQILRLPQANTLVVANGGIVTHPDSGRKTLNANNLSPSLSYLNSSNGELIDQFYPQSTQMSVRHIDIDQQGRVIIGIQLQSSDLSLPLVLSHQGEDQLQALAIHDQSWSDFNGYIASVAINPAGTHALATSPRGDTIGLWNLESQQYQTIRCRDVAGATYCPDRQRFFISNGNGQIETVPLKSDIVMPQAFVRQPRSRWDNHLVKV